MSEARILVVDDEYLIRWTLTSGMPSGRGSLFRISQYEDRPAVSRPLMLRERQGEELI
jgi:hypothetical protein